MREKYETLALKDLKALAKIRGIKGYSTMSKEEIVDAMVAKDEEEALSKAAKEPEKEAKEASKAKKATKVSKSDKAEKADKEEKAEKPAKEEKAQSGEKAAGQAKKDDGEKTSKPEKNVKVSKAKNDDKEKKPGKKAEPEKTVEDKKPEEPSKDTESKDEKPKTEGSSEVRPESKVYGKTFDRPEDADENLDSGINAHGILEVMPEGYCFIRCDNFLPGADDVYVAPGQIRKFGLKTGDIVDGNKRVKTQNEKFSALLYLRSVNGYSPEVIKERSNFEDMTPIFPDSRIKLEMPGSSVAMRVMDLLSPVGKGQRGMIVSPPKAGKTTLLKEVAKSVKRNHPDIHMIILLIDERPEEVTDIKEAIEGPNVEVIYSTFDELPEHHKRVSEMVIERAKRLVEHHKDVMILLDSITRLTRAYNLTVPPSGRTLSGGLDPAALHMPKRFFGAARNMREGGSLTILATALVETGSKMDDVVYEEFKGTGNMEMVLDRKLSERRIFPAIDIAKSGTRRDDLLLNPEEISAVNSLRRGINGLKPEESVDRILDMFAKTRGNQDFIHMVNKIHMF